MKSIKRSLQESRLNTHRLIRAWLQPRLGEVGNRFRLGGRIRLANRWARKHPRRTFACVVGSLAFLLAGNIAGDVLLTGNRETDEATWTGTESLNGIALVEPMFQGFRTIQANKNVHRTTLMELTGRGQKLREELDSLIALPRKSHADSIRIVQRYQQLEHIVQSLKNNDTHDEN